MRVAKWGNTLAVRLPEAMVEALGLKEGDDVEIHVTRPRPVTVTERPNRRQVLRRLRKYRGRLPATVKFDRFEENERG